MAVERLLSATAEADGKRRRLTAIAYAYRRDCDDMPGHLG